MTRNHHTPAETDRRCRQTSTPATVAAPPPVARVQPVDWPDRGCCWPTWERDNQPRRFCAETVRNPGEPYCAGHMARAYVPWVRATEGVAA